MLLVGSVSLSINPTFNRIVALVVDDDTHHRKIVRSLLMSFGVRRVYEAADGAQGLELIQQYRPDVVLLDWEMPMLTGAEMVRLIRNPFTSAFAAVPIILVTGYTERYRIQQALQLGVNEILCKPFSSKALWQRLDLVVNHPRPFIQKRGYFGPLPREAQAGLMMTAPVAQEA